MPKKYTYLKKDPVNNKISENNFVYRDKPTKNTDAPIGIIIREGDKAEYGFNSYLGEIEGLTAEELLSIAHHIKRLKNAFEERCLIENEHNANEFIELDEEGFPPF